LSFSDFAPVGPGRALNREPERGLGTNNIGLYYSLRMSCHGTRIDSMSAAKQLLRRSTRASGPGRHCHCWARRPMGRHGGKRWRLHLLHTDTTGWCPAAILAVDSSPRRITRRFTVALHPLPVAAPARSSRATPRPSGRSPRAGPDRAKAPPRAVVLIVCSRANAFFL